MDPSSNQLNEPLLNNRLPTIQENASMFTNVTSIAPNFYNPPRYGQRYLNVKNRFVVELKNTYNWTVYLIRGGFLRSHYIQISWRESKSNGYQRVQVRVKSMEEGQEIISSIHHQLENYRGTN